MIVNGQLQARSITVCLYMPNINVLLLLRFRLQIAIGYAIQEPYIGLSLFAILPNHCVHAIDRHRFKHT